MGTQHGYTEKECKVCHEVKSRAEFPTFGGLTCRECIKIKDREKQPERHKQDSKNPAYLERKRRNARDYKRRKKLERDRGNNMSVEETAGALRQAGAATAEAIAGIIGGITTDLDAIMGKLQQAQTAAEDSTSMAASLLGESHSGTTAIVGAAAHVVETIETVRGLIAQFGLEKDSVMESGGVLSQRFEEVANALMQGPSY